MHPTTAKEMSVSASPPPAAAAKTSETVDERNSPSSNDDMTEPTVAVDGAASSKASQETLAYQSTRKVLEDPKQQQPHILDPTPLEFLVPMTSVVSLRDAVMEPPIPRPVRRSHNNIDNNGDDSNGDDDVDDDDDDDDSEGVVRQHAPLPITTRVTLGGARFPGILQNRHSSTTTPGDRTSFATTPGAGSPPSLLTPNRGHHALFRALEVLESLEKQEAELQLRSRVLTPTLTTIVTGDEYDSPQQAMETLEAWSKSVPRRVCQHPFKKNDIVWVCRTCQADETCVLCHNCFKASNHEGHDVAFYHAQAGGCCDCGDPDAWDPAGFCNRHGPGSASQCMVIDDGDGENDGEQARRGPLNRFVVERVKGVVPAAVDWMVESVATAAENGHARTEQQPQQIQQQQHEEGEASAVEPSEHDDGADEASTDMSVDDQSVFSPAAAGSSRLKRGHAVATAPTAPVSLLGSSGDRKQTESTVLSYTNAESLGMLARDGGGLYLVLKSDDIHTSPPLVDALRELFGTSSLYTESILQKVVRAIKQFGQLVVWGTMELLAEMTPTQIQLWLDGDRIASGVLGTAMLNKAKLLTSHGLFCSILTRNELLLEQRAVAVLQWLTSLARSCDPVCQTVAESIWPDRHLVPMLRADFKLSSRITKYWHSFLLTLLAVPTFKSHLAAAYCDTYQDVTAEYARGMGVLERSGYALSVQFLNRVTYVVDLVQRRDLLGKLGASLYQALDVAANEIQQGAKMGRRLDPNHFVLTHRRYSPCISDLKCVLNVKGMPRLFASSYGSFLKDWIAALCLGQMMDPQVWRDWNQGHVELEVRGWVGAFNASISLGSLFERLLSWDDSDPSPIEDPNSPLSSNLMSCVELTRHVMLAGVHQWQTTEVRSYEATPTSATPYKRRSASLPFSTVSVRTGSVLAFRALPIAQNTPFSFHLPLHRFVAACLRETCLRKNGVENLRIQFESNTSESIQDELYLGLMEFPLLVISRAAQVRAGLWRRNGNGLNDQVLNYAEPPFCRAMRDADLLLVQFAMLRRTRHQTTDQRPNSDVGVCFLVHLLLHRLGLFDFCGLAKAPDADINRYLDEIQKGLYNPEKSSEEMGDHELGMPSTYSPARDAASSLLLLEEFLHTMIILCTELPPVSPTSKSDHTAQAKWRLKREVIHRLACGPKTHSELTEVHHVLSHWDNVYLSEEGKLVNPDDATGAALGAVLAEVANRKLSRGKMEPDKWELNRASWQLYDPSFFHINLRNHQTAAESRPALQSGDKYKINPKPFCPPPSAAHSSFLRLRRDITSDATLLATTYRTLHIHIRDTQKKKESHGLRGSIAYKDEGLSETALTRAVHLLTLGAYSWGDASPDNTSWREHGGGSIGSVFFDRSDDSPAPTAKEWISAALLANPRTQQASEWYAGEENCLQLLRRIAVDGGYEGCFVAQDRAVQAGAAWLCEFAANHNIEARKFIRLKDFVEASGEHETKQETEAEKRKRIAKERAMERMKAQAARFASMMQAEMGENDENEASVHGPPLRETGLTRQGSFASGSSAASTSDNEKVAPLSSLDTSQGDLEDTLLPARLMKCRPRCIICNEDGGPDKPKPREEVGHRKSRRKRNDGGNALAFVGYTQASTVMKGGGGPPIDSVFSSARRFVGAHIALCGHAIHSECWESYLATVSHREDRIVGKRDEFRCPLCQRLSNCLVPFIDVGVDWIEPATEVDSQTVDLSVVKSEDGTDAMSLEPSMEQNTLGPLSLHSFLTSTPWWVSRHNDGLVWDGQCAFVSDPKLQESSEKQMEVPSPTGKRMLRRSVRALRKKDLYAAWNAMMKTPRFVRRKLRPRADAKTGDGASGLFIGAEPPGVASSLPSDSAGETVVWRRFMDQVSDITYRSDGKRLGDENLHNDFGEFRHYIVEKYTYNMANRFADREPSDWPSCLFPKPLVDTERQELSREKLLSKLMMSTQAFTYSACCEANEARRLTRRAKIESSKGVAGFTSDENSIDSIRSQFGISDVICDGKVVLLPPPNSMEDDGCQPFNGRLGRLRYAGLAVMAAAGAVASDLVQLVLAFPSRSSATTIREPHRAPIVYPILYGHVLTHVVASICASGGRARARSDSLDLVWPISFSSKGSFIATEGLELRNNPDSVVDDAEGFVKLGLLARVLQVMLGQLDLEGLGNIAGRDVELLVLKTLRQVRGDLADNASSTENEWKLNCLSLVEIVLAKGTTVLDDATAETPHVESAILDRIWAGCILAADAACTYLTNVGVILQLIVPGVMARYQVADFESDLDGENTISTLKKLESLFQMESFSQMLQSTNVQRIVTNWYDTARAHSKATNLPGAAISGSGKAVCSRLYQTQGFRVHDWPMESCRDMALQHAKTTPTAISNTSDDAATGAAPMEIDPVIPTSPPTVAKVAPSTPSLVKFSSKKSVDLIGGLTLEVAVKNDDRPRIAMIPTSYTDLYAELGQLLPESEQTAVCLICGEVLNAGGKGECTKHSYKCGAGAGLFFLLQECAGLMMHNGKAAYIHSPYVDSHGETPQYRGRPLNLDLDRYDHLHEVWSGHLIRQQVSAERGSSRQLIVPDFY